MGGNFKLQIPIFQRFGILMIKIYLGFGFWDLEFSPWCPRQDLHPHGLSATRS